jgi:hypothetical protein
MPVPMSETILGLVLCYGAWRWVKWNVDRGPWLDDGNGEILTSTELNAEFDEIHRLACQSNDDFQARMRLEDHLR